MYRILILISCLFLPLLVTAQKKTVIILEKADNIIYLGNTEVAYLRKPIFRHDNAILTCDSAVLYGGEKNYFEAFGKVHINQADSVNIYSDRLTYDGNNKIAHLTQNVRMLHKDAVLTTNFLDYKMAPKIGNYWNNGKIVSKDVTVNSKTGYYFANSRDAYFRYNVVAVTSQSTIKSDTLRYNTLTNWTYFYGPTNITGKDDNMYTENGVYNTQSGDAIFGLKNLYTNGSRSLKGDSLYYYGAKGYGKAVKNIVFQDTTDKILFKGNLGEYFKSEERVVVTQNAYFGLHTEDSVMVNGIKVVDTLWTSADTLSSMMVLKKDIKPIRVEISKDDVAVVDEGIPLNSKNTTDSLTNKNAVLPKETKSLPPDSLMDKSVLKLPGINENGVKDSLQTDTVKSRVIFAYHNVKVYKSNFQARADSLFYADVDSTLRWYNNPIIWAENSQQTGDTIFLELKNKKLHKTDIFGNGFIVNVEGDSVNFNQIKGNRITGAFVDGEINNMDVQGNAESIYFNRNKDVVTDMHQSFAGRIIFDFINKSLANIHWREQSEGKLTPFDELKDNKLLTGFIWKPELRPLSKEDVIGLPVQEKPVVLKKEP